MASFIIGAYKKVGELWLDAPITIYFRAHRRSEGATDASIYSLSQRGFFCFCKATDCRHCTAGRPFSPCGSRSRCQICQMPCLPRVPPEVMHVDGRSGVSERPPSRKTPFICWLRNVHSL